jgi:hypothetical protein
LAEPELFLKTQRQSLASWPAGVERDLEIAVAILRRVGRRLAEALPEMDRPQRNQAQSRIESARRELDRMAAGIGQARLGGEARAKKLGARRCKEIAIKASKAAAKARTRKARERKVRQEDLRK